MSIDCKKIKNIMGKFTQLGTKKTFSECYFTATVLECLYPINIVLLTALVYKFMKLVTIQ